MPTHTSTAETEDRTSNQTPCRPVSASHFTFSSALKTQQEQSLDMIAPPSQLMRITRLMIVLMFLKITIYFRVVVLCPIRLSLAAIEGCINNGSESCIMNTRSPIGFQGEWRSQQSCSKIYYCSHGIFKQQDCNYTWSGQVNQSSKSN